MNQKKNQKKDSTTKKCLKMDGFLRLLMLREILIAFPGLKLNNFFKNTFFPSAIIEWNKLDPSIQNAEGVGIFKSNILKFIRPTPRGFFNCYNHKGIRLTTRLHLGLSHLRENKFSHNHKTVLILFAVVVWISNQRLTFFSTVLCLMIKESLSWAL